jgi:hypothetical protein
VTGPYGARFVRQPRAENGSWRVGRRTSLVATPWQRTPHQPGRRGAAGIRCPRLIPDSTTPRRSTASTYGTEGQRFESSRARLHRAFSSDLTAGLRPKVKTFLARFQGLLQAPAIFWRHSWRLSSCPRAKTRRTRWPPRRRDRRRLIAADAHLGAADGLRSDANSRWPSSRSSGSSRVHSAASTATSIEIKAWRFVGGVSCQIRSTSDTEVARESQRASPTPLATGTRHRTHNWPTRMPQSG